MKGRYFLLYITAFIVCILICVHKDWVGAGVGGAFLGALIAVIWGFEMITTQGATF
jgi:hypothetical protein